MTDNTTLLTRAQTLKADCNQTESAREVIAELVAAVAALGAHEPLIGGLTALDVAGALESEHAARRQAEQRITTLQAALTQLHDELKMFGAHSEFPNFANLLCKIATDALSLTPTPNVAEKGLKQQQGVPE